MKTGSDTQMAMIFGRRSIRVYSPGNVSETQVTNLLEAAMAAPSAMTKDPWRFVVVRDQKVLAELASGLPGGKMLATASCSIVVCGDLDAAFENHIGYMVQDCSAATQNLLLAAHALGLGACWVGVYPSEGSMQRIRELLGAPKQVVPLAVISIGIPGEQLPPRTRYNASFVRQEKW